MSAPPTVKQGYARKLIAEPGIHTFPNGSSWEDWADANCYRCRHWNDDGVGRCAFEYAAFVGQASPALAQLFGWTQDPKWDRADDHTIGWSAPDSCAFFLNRDERGGDRPRRTKPQNPRQLVLIADPTEDAAILTNAPVPVEVMA